MGVLRLYSGIIQYLHSSISYFPQRVSESVVSLVIPGRVAAACPQEIPEQPPVLFTLSEITQVVYE